MSYEVPSDLHPSDMVPVLAPLLAVAKIRPQTSMLVLPPMLFPLLYLSPTLYYNVKRF